MAPTSPVAVATTPAAIATLAPLCATWDLPLWVPAEIALPPLPPQPINLQRYTGRLQAQLAALWPIHDGFIFALAAGAVVRLIAPLLQHKAQDPAVVVVDGAGQFAISLCSGHQGGADALAQRVALALGGQAVLTGASNHLQLPPVDTLGEPFGWQRGAGRWLEVSAAVAQGQPVQVIQEAGSPLWQQHLPAEHPFQFGWETVDPPAARLWISAVQRRFAPDGLPKAQWHPRVLWVGMGCERGTSLAVLTAAIDQTCQRHHLAPEAIAGLASLDLKADEPALVALAQQRGWPLRCFGAEELKAVAVPNPSVAVQQAVGTPSVAEAAALQAARTDQLQVTKQVVRLPEQPGAATIAIAQATTEETGRQGQLWLVGTGPGQLDQLTPAAQQAIGRADAVIGYGLYLDLIRPLLRPGQIVEPWPLTQERQRGERAIALARWGLDVAVVSSGDCGIYGMAGLVLEQLQGQGWDGSTPGVEVLPGISAIQAAAARLGAPLMHDFCAISLSDLLTPWPVIEQRLQAAAQADFVVALYNPKSRTRTWQIQTAQAILSQHRPVDTPVAVVRAAYRADEHIYTATLDRLLDLPIDMVSLVLVGNTHTRRHHQWLITPRGYASAPPQGMS